jgi:uncharacterized protein YydD (DUF2326 family)
LEELKALEAQLSKSTKALDRLSSSVTQAKVVEEEALLIFRAAEAAEEKVLDSSSRGDRLLAQLEDLRELIREHGVKLSLVVEEQRRKGERTQQLKVLRTDSRSTIRELSYRFDEVIRELLPGEVTGAVVLNGAELAVKVTPGEWSTAIDSWKAVAFDLSALTLACEGAAKLPPWLLHDSPREGDLGESVYERLFRFTSNLEQMAHFQYIVTTTTPPPESMRNSPFLRAKLKSGPASERLLRSNL